MFLLISSFLAGVLTSLAPCILPLLPVIIGSSILTDGNKKLDRLKPFIIVASLAVSVILFTILLKVSTVLIGVDPSVWLYASGSIVIVLGITMLFPSLWVRASSLIGLEHSSNKLLGKAYKQKGLAGPILTGAALGPVFSSCSPVYALVLATVLPVNLAVGIVYIFAYALGLAVALLAIALIGRRLTSKLEWAVNPSGWFRKILAIILILVGLLIITGYDKKFQVWAIEHIPFGVSSLEEKLIPGLEENKVDSNSEGNSMFNVKPYPAPELVGINEWINSDGESLKDLKGKVVLIDFWTYSCINCQRTQPYLNKWQEKYKDDGLVILGLHAPEFAFEKVPENVRKAVDEAGITYPVGLDNDFTTWQAYKNKFWPAKYLIDKDGNVRYTHFGEGKYEETEATIQALLRENGKDISDKIDKIGEVQSAKNGQSPETYLGYERGERFANADQFKADETVNYSLRNELKEHAWSFGGNWRIGDTQSVSAADNSVLRFKFSAKEVYLVMNGPSDKPVTLMLNNQPVTSTTNGGADVDAAGQVHLNGARLYKLIKLPSFTQNATLDITVPNGTTVNAFTFGG